MRLLLQKMLLLLALSSIYLTMWSANSDVVTTNVFNLCSVSFSTTGTYEWTYNSTYQRLQSTNYNIASSTSTTTISFNCNSSTLISFDYKVSSESGSDKFYATMDGTTIISSISGLNSGSYSATFSSGYHYLVLSYAKDGSVNSNDDRAYISNLQLKPSGKCGNNISWSLASDSTLTLTGSGNMYNYDIEDQGGDEDWWWVCTSPFSGPYNSRCGGYYYDSYDGIGSYVNNIKISEDITSIGSYAFVGCSNARTISIPSTVESIGFYSFQGCSALKSISLPEALKSISYYSFVGCESLESLTIPANMTSIYDSAFKNCYLAKDKFVNNSTLSSTSNWGLTLVDEETQDGLLIKNNAIVRCRISAGNISIPNYITSISQNAFISCGGLTSLTIPDNVQEIGNEAFENCYNLTNLTIGKNITKIGNLAFYNCNKLTNLIYNAKNIADLYFYEDDEDGDLYTLPESITTVSIGDNVENIPTNFLRKTNITSVTLPNSVKSVGNRAFYDCSKLTTPSFSDNIENIGSEFMQGTPWLNKLSTVETYVGKVFLKYKGNSDITIKSGTTQIYYNAFQNSYVKSIQIPNSVTTINDGAFSNCNSLASFGIESLKQWFDLNVGSFTTKSYKLLIDNVEFKEWVVADSIAEIQGSAFKNCSSLTNVQFNKYVSAIGNYAFYNCTGLKKLDLPESLTSIGYQTFYNITPTAIIFRGAASPTISGSLGTGGSKRIYVPFASIDAYKAKIGATYSYLPLLDVMFFEKTNAAAYAAELNGKDKSAVTSVAFYDGGIDTDMTEEIIKNGMNPNCLYYVPDSLKLNGDNFISLDNYTADKITLTDNYTYDCPIPFHTADIEYVHNPSVWANGTSGWETICLPFAPTAFKASERGYISPIMLGSTGNFWLRKFVGAASDAVYFASTSDGVMEAHTPYIIAFPGKTMGTGHLEGQTITFIGGNADIPVTTQPTQQYNDFIFTGNYDKTADDCSGWALDAAGSSFVQTSTVGNQPFAAYFRNTEGGINGAKALRMDFSTFDESTDIENLTDGNMQSDEAAPVYSIDGKNIGERSSAEMKNMKSGLYIRNNKKVIVK